MESQLERIKDKEALHRWIDDQSDDARFLVMADPGDDAYSYQCVGDFTCAEVVYMAECLKFEMLEQDSGEDDDGDDR